MTSPRSADVDACPGALRLHAAADGLLARVRLPGGMLTGVRLRSLRELTERFGDGRLELTSRANVQIRGVRAEHAETLAAGLRTAGLLPSTTHDSVRNIASPPRPGSPLRALVPRLDAAICDDPALSRLPGKFLFAVGHVPLAADVAAVPAGDSSESRTAPGAPAGERYAIRFAGHDTGLRVGFEQVVPTLIAAAHAFLGEREAQRGDGPAAWRLRELADGPARVSARVAAATGLVQTAVEAAAPVETFEPGDLLGVLEQPDGLAAVGALVPLGQLSGVPMRVLEGADRLVVTPWRGVIVTDLAHAAAAEWADRLIASGLPVTADSPWVGVTSCAGRPGCARSLADVRADAAAASRFVDGLPVHWVGCGRACGSPAGRHVRVEATGTGYRVDRLPAGREPVEAARDAAERDLGDMVAAARSA
ncbi:precorrin-3B synthase [Actinoplanes aureus]|uniref:Precorrin-3B synthase n=1 Tax=Actinoplanes aureus TaxID=2792083 RepID=A0A931C6H8_9ACTN|nr:precorrin-3B synthase [Actinoplanes aureus]MBG0560358.1 precorrin-3B synthase [Actinoplanes aureus]